jgi:hypothetical protein
MADLMMLLVLFTAFVDQIYLYAGLAVDNKHETGFIAKEIRKHNYQTVSCPKHWICSNASRQRKSDIMNLLRGSTQNLHECIYSIIAYARIVH